MDKTFVDNLLSSLPSHPLSTVMTEFTLKSVEWEFTTISVSNQLVTFIGISATLEACLNVSVNTVENKIKEFTFTTYEPPK